MNEWVRSFQILDWPIGLILAKYTVMAPQGCVRIFCQEQTDRLIYFQYSINKKIITCHKHSTSTHSKKLEPKCVLLSSFPPKVGHMLDSE